MKNSAVKERKDKNKNPTSRSVLILILVLFVVFAAWYILDAVDGNGTFGGIFDDNYGDETIRNGNSDDDMRFIYENRKRIPTELLDALERNEELASFVKNYPEAEMKAVGGFNEKELNQGHPLLLQWDERWGYYPYCGKVMGLTGCGPTCMSMVVLALTGNSAATPDRLAYFAEKNGHAEIGHGTAWTFMTAAAEDYGIFAEELPLWEPRIKEVLDNDGMIICSMKAGDFTESGHFIVIYGYDDEGFLVNDPNSVSNSSRKWTYERIEGQISNLWAYSI